MKKKINLDKKIAIIEDFLNRRTVGKITGICLHHLEKVKSTKITSEIELKQLFKDYLETIEPNNARREMEMDAFKNADNLI